MKYLSVCSGIEAASVAWHPLGWEPVGFSEIDPFPSAVLAHRFPGIPNYGDITKFRDWPIRAGDINLLVGGTPCQSFSVAGLRRGLADPRGNIMLTYLALVEHLRPRWVVWENVPGVLSSGRGRDFGTFLGALGQLGYGWSYRVLDAQWVRTQRHSRAVPQRRRRVFVVGCLGDTTSAAAVLFESESVQRHSSSRGAQRENIAATIAARFGVSRNNFEECVSQKTTIWPAVVASTLNAHFGNKLGLEDQHALNGAPLFVHGNDVTPYQKVVGSLCARDHKAIGNQCVAQGKIVVAYTKAKQAQSATDDESWVVGAVAPTQNAFDVGDTRATNAVVAATGGMTVRRLTPRECERLQGFPDDWTLVPWRKGIATDGNRYKAIGNSMAVNCMEWIGERIAQVDAR